MQKISFIAALSENRVLGADNQLIWHLPADWENFKRVTQGGAFIMGRKSYVSKDMLYSDHLNVVLSRSPQKELPEGFVAASTTEQALALLKDEPEVFVLGGGEIFRQLLPMANYMYLTIVHHHFEGDAFFPEIRWADWELVKSRRVEVDEQHAYAFSLNEYARRAPAAL
ncbi:MAG: dihydrofolate reductase [Bacteroidota bacterium]